MRTKLTDLLGIEIPIVQAGMAFPVTTPELVAAVSAAGGLGLLGCLNRPPEQAVADIRRVRSLTDRPFGLNFVVHRLDEATFAACLAEAPAVINLFRGDFTGAGPRQVIARSQAAGARVIYQITTVDEARAALAAGADGLVAQGHEAGGHNGPVPLWGLLPAVVRLAGERPVLAAGGLVDGRDLAAALCLGAAGIVMGTRFLATPEAAARPIHKQAIVAAGLDATLATTLYDRLWQTDWPGVTARALRNAFFARWLGQEDEMLRQREAVVARVHQAEAAEDRDEMLLLAGMGAGRIEALKPAGAIVRDLLTEAEQLLVALGGQH